MMSQQKRHAEEITQATVKSKGEKQMEYAKEVEQYLDYTNGYVEKQEDGYTIHPLGDDPIEFETIEELTEFCKYEVEESRKSLAQQGEDLNWYIEH